jgi:tRNA (guanine37-N1)-methyltransferase
MRIDILTILPELLEGPFSHSILKRAEQKGLAEIHLHNIREFSLDKHRSVDDYAYGGSAGMVLMPEPLAHCIEKLTSVCMYDEIIYLTPDGEVFNQSTANQLSLTTNLLLVCGHYKGIDQRIRDRYITKEISIGDYVLSGGEIAATVLTDAVIRLIPGVMGDESSALSDSHQDGLLAPPVYTRPAEFKGMKVPDILLSGNDKKIEDWKHEMAIERTKARRKDMWERGH